MFLHLIYLSFLSLTHLAYCNASNIPAGTLSRRISVKCRSGAGGGGEIARRRAGLAISALSLGVFRKKFARADRGDNLPEPIRKTFIKKVPKQIRDARRLRRLEDAVEVFDGLDDLLELEQYEDAKKLLRDPKVKYLRGNLREANEDYICNGEANDSKDCIINGASETLIGEIEKFDLELKLAIKTPDQASNEQLRNSADKLCDMLASFRDVVEKRTPKNIYIYSMI
ncbi:hypothetical protein AAMO2058_001724500 [Amorphochlora amoebiformis]